MRLVYNGLELGRFPFRPERGGDLSLLAVGRLVEKKGFPLFIEAVRRLRERGLPVTAEIAGDGPLRAALQEQIDRAGLGGAVTLLGPLTQAEVRELLGTRRLFVAPFIVGADGTPTGCPRCSWRPCPGASRVSRPTSPRWGEVVVPGRTGWLVPTGDVETLTDAVEEALRTDAAPLARNARRLVEDVFDSRGQAKILRELQSPPERG